MNIPSLRQYAITLTITKKILPCLRRMSLLLCCPNFATPLALHSFQCLRRPLPKSFSKFLRNIGVPVDRLQMDIVFGKDRRYNEREPDDKVHCLMNIAQICPGLGTIRESDTLEPQRHDDHLIILYHECHCS